MTPKRRKQLDAAVAAMQSIEEPECEAALYVGLAMAVPVLLKELDVAEAREAEAFERGAREIRAAMRLGAINPYTALTQHERKMRDDGVIGIDQGAEAQHMFSTESGAKLGTETSQKLSDADVGMEGARPNVERTARGIQQIVDSLKAGVPVPPRETTNPLLVTMLAPDPLRDPSDEEVYAVAQVEYAAYCPVHNADLKPGEPPLDPAEPWDAWLDKDDQQVTMTLTRSTIEAFLAKRRGTPSAADVLPPQDHASLAAVVGRLPRPMFEDEAVFEAPPADSLQKRAHEIALNVAINLTKPGSNPGPELPPGGLTEITDGLVAFAEEVLRDPSDEELAGACLMAATKTDLRKQIGVAVRTVLAGRRNQR